jgi:cystathionine beta-lyase
LLILCNPHNPLGRVYDRDELLKLSEIVARHDGRVFSDEIHAPITYAGYQHIPYASVSPEAAGHTVTATSASKSWNLAGLKCAQLILSNETDAETWKQTSSWAEHGVSTFGAIANAAAYNLGESWLNEVLEYLDGNRTALVELLAAHLPEVGYVMPEGTYLAWLDFRPTGIGDDVDSFFREHARVAVTNGCACGEAGTGHVRFNLAMTGAMLEESIKQMAAAVRANVGSEMAAAR